MIVRLLPAPLSYATGTLTLAGNAVADETVTIGTKVYTWRAAPTTEANAVLIGATASDSCDNLIAAITGAAGSGSLYGSLTVASTQVTAAAGASDTVVVTALQAYEGLLGEFATTETMTAGSWGATTLILQGAAATNGAPSGLVGFVRPTYVDQAVLLLKSTAGSGTMTVTCKLWGYSIQTATWYPLGTGATAANKGLINEGNAIGETGTDVIAHAEPVSSLFAFERLYLEITSIGGTGTAIAAYLDCRQAATVTT